MDSHFEQPTETILLKISPELIEKLRDWSNPVQVRAVQWPTGQWEMEVRDVENESPLGLTPEHVQRGQKQAEIDDLRAKATELIDQFQQNLDFLDSLPAGTIIACPTHTECPGHPVEMYR